MELVAMDMKLRGMYIARQLSFKGVTFKIEEIPLEKNFVKVYNDSVRMVGFNVNYAIKKRILAKVTGNQKVNKSVVSK